MATTEEYPIHSIETYSDETYLNTVEICIPQPPSSNGIWILYIHGGAWRDPAITASSFKRIQEELFKSSIADNISGYASINYRLSPYPSHQTDPSNPSDPARNARHPDHINDVLAAILYLQEKYHFEDRYVLAGHSAGATLAFQVALKRYWGSQYESTFALELNVVPPVAIVGLEGIYDISALVKYHEDQPVYRDFIHNAFGSPHWDMVSPTHGDYEESWPDGKIVVLAHSPNDNLIEAEQGKLMEEGLVGQGWEKPGKTIHGLSLEGGHDEVWETGEAAKAIELAVMEVLRT